MQAALAIAVPATAAAVEALVAAPPSAAASLSSQPLASLVPGLLARPRGKKRRIVEQHEVAIHAPPPAAAAAEVAMPMAAAHFQSTMHAYAAAIAAAGAAAAAAASEATVARAPQPWPWATNARPAAYVTAAHLPAATAAIFAPSIPAPAAAASSSSTADAATATAAAASSEPDGSGSVKVPNPGVSDETRGHLIRMCCRLGYSTTNAAEALGIQVRTAQRVVKEFHDTGRVLSKPRGGDKRKPETRERIAAAQAVHPNQDLIKARAGYKATARKVNAKLKEKLNKSKQFIRERILAELTPAAVIPSATTPIEATPLSSSDGGQLSSRTLLPASASSVPQLPSSHVATAGAAPSTSSSES